MLCGSGVCFAMLKNTKCSAFFSCLQFAVLNSDFTYCNVILKPKQVICLENIFLKRDVLAVLPTGYGKSLVFLILPALLLAKKKFDDTEAILNQLTVVTSIIIVTTIFLV